MSQPLSAGVQPDEPFRMAPAATGARILIVDPDRDELASVEDALQAGGYFTATAFNAFGAVVTVNRTGAFDLLITAIEMPGMTGVELTRALRQRDASLQVLFLTSCHAELFGRVLLTPDDDTIEKPFSDVELLETVEALLLWRRRRTGVRGR